MNIKTKGIIILISAILVQALFSTGCSKEEERVVKGKTIVVTDSIGRKVSVPARVKRIACMYAFTGHVVVMLEKCSSIVAVVNGLKRDKVLIKICPAISKASVPKYNAGLNIEELASVKPDVLFMKESSFYHRGDFKKIQKLGIPVVVISFNDIESQVKAVEIIGKVIGATEKADQYISYFRKCIKTAGNIAKQVPEKKRVRIYHSILEPLKTDCLGSLSADWIEKSGLVNVSLGGSLKTRGEDKFASLEQVILWNPDAIIVNEEGVDKYIMSEKKWGDIKAVKTGRVYKMPTGISRWGHPGSLETPLAVLWAIKTFYPEYTESIDLGAETKFFYREFFKTDLSDEMTKKILKGEGMRSGKNKKRKKQS